MQRLLMSFLTAVVVNGSSVGAALINNSESLNQELNSDTLEYHMLDVGNGLTTIIKKSNSNSAILYDTGIGGPPLRWYQPKYAKNQFVVNYLQSLKVEKLSAIFLSHFHTDHYSNFEAIWKKFNEPLIMMSISSNKWIKAFGKMVPLENFVDYAPSYEVEGITFKNLSYSSKNWMKGLKEKGNDKENNKSTVLTFSYNGKRFLLSGDTDKELGSQILQNEETIDPVDFYQVPHHGSRNAAGPDFLAKIKPKTCYMSGMNPREYENFQGSEQDYEKWTPQWAGGRGHIYPHPTAIKNLTNIGCQIKWTGQSGTLIYKVSPNGAVSESTREDYRVKDFHS